jgi:hypothetical protein
MVNPTYAEVQQKLTILVIEVTKREREEQSEAAQQRSLERSHIICVGTFNNNNLRN